jgi:exonuclease SbcC
MKPLILTLQAIGPYAGRQSVDFRAVLDSGLFGIYGATGSGKSTIFSAMTFALFGEAARSEQHATSLRSDHADANLLTQVELIFEAGERTYRIVRQPEQTRPAKRGGGETSESHKAWLFDVTDLDLGKVSDSNPGKVVAENKVTLVNEAIRKILGYGTAQFRQIVLLPQGRFEAFLSADTQERIRILRDLFDVSLYRRLAESVKSRSDAAEKEVAAARTGCTARLTAEEFATMEQLVEGLAEAEHRHRDLRDAAAKAKSEWDAAVAAFQAAAQTDARFREHLEAEAELARIHSTRNEIADTESRLKLARVVASLADAAAARDTARRETDDASARHAQAADRLKAIEAKAAAARSSLTALLQKSPEIDKQKSTLQTFRTYQFKLEATQNLKAAAAAAKRTALERTASTKKAKATLDTIAGNKVAASESFQAAQSAHLKRAQLNEAAADLRTLYSEATAFDDAVNKLRAAQDALNYSRADFVKAEQHFQQASAVHAVLEKALLQDHAAHLAAHLANGEACPVCGSHDHPAPARGTAGAERLDAKYAEAKARHEQARDAAAAAHLRVEVAQQAVAGCTAVLQALAPPPRAATDLAAELQCVKDEIKRLQPPSDLAALQAKIEELDAELSTASAALDDARQSELEASRTAAAAEQSFADALEIVPPDLREAVTLTAAINTLDATINAFIRDHESAMAADRQAAEAVAAAKAETETLAREVERLADQLARRQTHFAARLAEHGLTAEDYEMRKADVSSIPAMGERIRQYSTQIAAAESHVQRTAEFIAQLQRPDLDALAATRDAASKAFDAAQAAATTALARFTQLQKLQSDLAAEGRRLDALEKETAPLRELAEAFTGRTYHRIDLETFAISTLFDRVLEAANLRLAPMTRARYSLVRETEGRGNARRGLGIAVEDTYTGRQRPTSTLSGGETFIAALALALGLSDIVESAHGNVRLDTIFIDEGFGSLDSDGDSGTLETVLQTLQDIVGASRSVGLISHVPLVQQAIPNGFFVTKTPGGSHIEVRT